MKAIILISFIVCSAVTSRVSQFIFQFIYPVTIQIETSFIVALIYFIIFDSKYMQANAYKILLMMNTD